MSLEISVFPLRCSLYPVAINIIFDGHCGGMNMMAGYGRMAQRPPALAALARGLPLHAAAACAHSLHEWMSTTAFNRGGAAGGASAVSVPSDLEVNGHSKHNPECKCKHGNYASDYKADPQCPVTVEGVQIQIPLLREARKLLQRCCPSVATAK